MRNERNFRDTFKNEDAPMDRREKGREPEQFLDDAAEARP
jgi:hypothetical protein